MCQNIERSFLRYTTWTLSILYLGFFTALERLSANLPLKYENLQHHSVVRYDHRKRKTLRFNQKTQRYQLFGMKPNNQLVTVICNPLNVLIAVMWVILVKIVGKTTNIEGISVDILSLNAGTSLYFRVNIAVANFHSIAIWQDMCGHSIEN